MKKLLLLLCILSLVVVAGCSSTPENMVPVADDVSDTSASVSLIIDNSSKEPTKLADSLFMSVNTVDSVLNWHAKKIVGSAHKGTAPIKEGTLEFFDGEFLSGSFVIDMTAITADNNGLLSHLKSEDFFAVETYPTSTFVLSKGIEDVYGDFTITGNLTIRNVTNEITFDASVEQKGFDLIMETEFSIDRTRWGITYGSGSVVDTLGDKAIKDDIDYSLHLVLN